MQTYNSNKINVICINRIACWSIRFTLKVLPEIDNKEKQIDSLKTLLTQADNDVTKLFPVYSDDNLIIKLERILKTVAKKSEDETSIVTENIEWLANELNLSPIECQLLEFSTYLEINRKLAMFLSIGHDLSFFQSISHISNMLNIPYKDISEALSVNGRLIELGLIKENLSSFGFLVHAIEIDVNLSTQLSSPQIKSEFYKAHLIQTKPSKLKVRHYYFIHHYIKIIKDYLALSLQTKRKGVNILLYGTPGTGKTELAKVISSQLYCKLFEVANEQYGQPLSSTGRFASYRLGQQLLKNKSSLIILFDEIEDVFPTLISSLQGQNSKKLGKALMTKTLENNPVPAIWISNDISQIDPAYIRRFDLVFEIKIPPFDTRKRMIHSSFKNAGISEEWAENLAKHKGISPALISNTANVAQLLVENSARDTEESIELILNQSLRAMGYKKILRPKKTINYNLNYLNTSLNISTLVDKLHVDSCARICLYGPPGTGKTAFAEYIAKNLGIPLFIKRASDLFGPYVGQTEANIAAAFSDATDDEVVFLIDEADSFLQKRTRANHSWQVSQVNEFLTQMENYQGIFFCTTNLMENFDDASLRRFDLKIELDYLTKEQAWKFFNSFMNEQGITIKQKNKIRQELNTIDYLTPGDFATIKRSNKLFQEAITAQKLLQRLKEEVSHKEISKKSQGIGFMTDY